MNVIQVFKVGNIYNFTKTVFSIPLLARAGGTDFFLFCIFICVNVYLVN